MEIQAFYDTHQITSHGVNMPRPILGFEEANFPGEFLKKRISLFTFALSH